MDKKISYRPLTTELAQYEAFAGPGGPAPGGPEPGDFKPTEKMLERMANEEKLKDARREIAALFTAGKASYNGLTQNYRLYTPKDMENGKKYPLVVFLHGGGERGDDNELPLLANDGAIVWVRDQLEGGEKAFVLAMQCPADEPGWLEKHLLVLKTAIDQLTESNPIDQSRLYLIGMSMGGGGCWRMNYMFPDMFAAVVPMCAAASIKTDRTFDQPGARHAAEAFLNKPLWMFHAADDFVVTPESSRQLANELEALGKKRGVDFFYTEYAAENGYNHGCWEPALADETMRKWLFSQRMR